MNRTTIKIGQQSKPEIRQQLIGIVAHQCHETFDIDAQPAPDDRVGAYAEIVRHFGWPARIAIARGKPTEFDQMFHFCRWTWRESWSISTTCRS